MLGLAAGLQKGGSALLNYVKDNLKLYLDFKQTSHNTLKFPCEGSTDFVSSSSQYINVGNSSSLQITGNIITVTAWVNIDTDTDWMKIISNSTGGSYTDGYTFFYSNEQFHFSINHETTNVAKVAYTDYGSWHHLTGVYDGTLASDNIKIYLDGVQSATTDTYTANIGNTRDTYIGAGYTDAINGHMNGKMANVAVWTRALSIEEINSVMRKKYSQLKTIEKTSLVSWWALDTNYTDSHGSNDGTNSGSTLTTSIYGGNAPVLPRAVDVAREGEAEAIGNGSALFNGSSDYVSIPTQFSAGNAYSVSVWAYSSSSANIINQCDTSGNSNIYIQRVATNAYRGYLSSDDNNTYIYETTGNGVATVAGWDFVTATFNIATNTILIYVNGILQSTTSASSGTNATAMSTNTNLCAIGVRPKTSPDTFWNGNLSQVGIWQGVLTQAQIQAHMESTSYATIPASVKSTLSADLVTDGDMELAGVTNWDDVSGDTTIAKDTSIKQSGSQSLKVHTSDGNWGQSITTVNGSLYKWTLSFYYVTGRMRIYHHTSADVGSGTLVYDTNTTTTTTNTWITKTFYFVAGGTTTYIGGYQSGTPTSYIDDFSVKLVTNDLVGYWALDVDGSDSTDNNNDGTLV
jgi:hypothetical protein